MASSVSDPSSSIVKRTNEYGVTTRSVKQSLKTIDLDPSELARDVGDIKRDQAKEVKDKVDKRLETINALTELKKLSAEVKKTGESLSNYLGMDKDTPNLWKRKTATVYDALGKDASNLVRVTSDQGTPIRDFTFSVEQLAKSDSIRSTNVFATKDTPLGLVGNLNIRVGASNYTIDVGGKNLNDIANAVNGFSATTKIKMEIIQTTATGGFQWQLIHLDKSVPIDLSGTDVGLLDGLFIPKNPGDATQPKVSTVDSLALKATYNGQSIVRNGSNYIENLIPDAVIEIYGTTTGNLSCSVEQDRESAADGFAKFVEAYNKLQAFRREQTAFENDKKTPKENAHLHGVSVLGQQNYDIQRVLSTWVNTGSTTAAKTLGEIGLSIGKSSTRMGSDGNITFDSQLDGDIIPDVKTLEKYLYSDKIAEVMAVVGNRVTNTNDYFRTYSIPNFMKNSTLSGVPITVSISKVNGVMTATMSANTATGVITMPAEYKAGGLVIGPKGSIFEGLSVGCATAQINALVDNGAPITTTLSATMGIFAALEKSIDDYIAYSTGKLDLEIKRLESLNEKDSQKAAKLESDAMKDEENLMREFQYIREIEAAYKSFTDMFESYMKILTSDKR